MPSGLDDIRSAVFKKRDEIPVVIFAAFSLVVALMSFGNGSFVASADITLMTIISFVIGVFVIIAVMGYFLWMTSESSRKINLVSNIHSHIKKILWFYFGFMLVAFALMTITGRGSQLLFPMLILSLGIWLMYDTKNTIAEECGGKVIVPTGDNKFMVRNSGGSPKEVSIPSSKK